MKHAREDYNRFQDPENKIPVDEPVFLLRGQDIMAPMTLRHWAHSMLDARKYDIALLAFKQADAMEKWQEVGKGQRKIADL